MCKICSKPSFLCIDYYVLGLNFREWFLTLEQCERLMAHWSDRDQWFNNPQITTVPDNQNFGMAIDFVNYLGFGALTKAMFCLIGALFCHAVVSASSIQEVSACERPVTCQNCSNSFHIVPREVVGDPRNQVVLIHEDGWNCFSTSQTSMAAITITHGCMSKSERSDADNALVYSFIPTSQLPTDSPHKFDAFFKPLLDELEELFIIGEVFFRNKIIGVRKTIVQHCGYYHC